MNDFNAASTPQRQNAMTQGSNPPQQSSEFFMGMLHQSLLDIRQKLDTLVTQPEFESLRRDVTSLAESMREGLTGAVERDRLLDVRVDALEKIRERIYGVAIGISVLFGGGAAMLVEILGRN